MMLILIVYHMAAMELIRQSSWVQPLRLHVVMGQGIRQPRKTVNSIMEMVDRSDTLFSDFSVAKVSNCVYYGGNLSLASSILLSFSTTFPSSSSSISFL